MTRTKTAHIIVRDNIAVERLTALDGLVVTQELSAFRIAAHFNLPTELYDLLDQLLAIGATLISLFVDLSGDEAQPFTDPTIVP